MSHLFQNGRSASQIQRSFLLLLVCAIAGSSSAQAQLSVTTSSTLNTNCNGTDCDYTGPSILINELMISPVSNDGSICGMGGISEGRGEWIELFNPNICEPVDISCYYLGNDTPDGPGGYVIPAGTIVPPAGFCLIRGANVPPVPANLLVANGGNVVELVVPAEVSDPGVCAAGTRIWFPNAGGWFAFYDSQGVPQDAVSWSNQANSSGSPCVPSLAGCTNVAALTSYDNIPADRKEFVSTANASDHTGLSLKRITDGGSWDVNNPGTPTYATCNGTCIIAGSSSCTGTATANATGGTPPYSYQWNDSQGQLTATAIDLCEGSYNVTVTDVGGQIFTALVVVGESVPVVGLNITDNICLNAGAVVLTGGTPVTAGSQSGIYSGTAVNNNTFDPATAGTGPHTITYTFTDAFGCTNAATDAINVNPLPVVTITGVSGPYCVSTNPETFNLQPAGGVLSGPGAVNNTFVPATAGVGTHTLTYTYTDNNGCNNSATASVQVVPAPAPTFSIPDFLCIYDPAVTLTATPAGGVFTIDNSTTPTTTFDPSATGADVHNVNYAYTDADGCQGLASEPINVIPRPALNLNLAANYCYGTLSAPVTPTPAGGTLSGDFVSGNSLNLSAAAPGTYTVNYSYADANGCENTLNQNFTVSPRLFPDFDYSVNCTQIVFFDNNTPSLPAAAFSWEFGGTGTSTQANPSQPFALPGNYLITLTATDAYNCSYDTVKSIYVEPGITVTDLQVPNVITANGDNVNDYVEFSPNFLECFNYKMYIMNRWGNVVYEMSNSNNRFYGLDKNGNALQDGVYFYTVESDDIDCEDPLFKPTCSGMINIAR